MLVLKRKRYVRRHVVGGSGLLDTIGNLMKRLTGNTAKQLASKLLLSAGKSAAAEAGKSLVSRFIPSTQPVSTINDIISKYQPSNLNNIISGTGAIKIQDLVNKLNTGAGLKYI